MRAPLVIYFLNALSQRSKTALSCSNPLNRDIAEMLTQHPRCERIFERKYMVCLSSGHHRFAIAKSALRKRARAQNNWQDAEKHEALRHRGIPPNFYSYFRVLSKQTELVSSTDFQK